MRSLVLLLAAIIALAPSASAQKRPITDADLFAFNWIGDTQLSPDGRTLVFVQASVTPDHAGYQTALYLLDLTTPGAAPVLLTPGTHDSSPRWNPNNSHIAFLRSASDATGKLTPPQLYLVSVLPTISSPVRLTDLARGVSDPQWCPNGQGLAFLSATPRDPASKRLADLKSHATGDAAHISDVKIIHRAIYRFNGEGLLDPDLVPQIYQVGIPQVGLPAPAPPQLLTNRHRGIAEYAWANSSWIVYTAALSDEPIFDPFAHHGLYAFDPALHHADTVTALDQDPLPVTTIAESLHVDLRGISLSHTASPTDLPTHLAFHASAEGPAPISHADTSLFTLDLDWTSGIPKLLGQPRNLTAFQGYEMGGSVGGDNTAPRGAGRNKILWNADNSRLLDIAGSRGSELLLSVDATSGESTQISARLQAVLAFASTPDQKSVIALISNPILLGDLFRLDPAIPPAGPKPGAQPPVPGNQTQLTHVNDALFSHLDLRMPERLKVVPTAHPADIPYLNIDAFVQLPPDFPQVNVVEAATTDKPAHPYPLILNIHGGPHSAYGWVFDHEMLVLAAKGYVVDYPNPRGSTTYGENFANIIQNNYPGDDYHDLMDSVDLLVKMGWADPAKLGVTGGSGGGLLTDWVVTQTNRFQAAVAQRDITDWSNWWYTADAISFHQSFEPKGAPFDNVDLYRAHSPITFVNNIKTPMLFILGDADYRTPPGSGGEDFFRALKFKHIPTIMVRFPRESHELSRSGEPWHRIERLQNIANWFDLYLQNKCQPQYDLSPNPTPTCKP
jgi:dipeptidyl aminopeptidase/acylaminoacyl peptidase